MSFSQWATPARRARLVELLTQSKGLCVHGHEGCTHLADTYSLLTTTKVVCESIPKAPSDPLYRGEVHLSVRVVKDHRPVLTSEGHCYELASETLIEGWKADDRLKSAQIRKLVNRHLHAAPQIWRRGPFDSIRREDFLAERPVYKVVGIGVNAFTQHRVAQVEIPGLKATIWVDLSGLKTEGLSKNQLRKLARYKRGAIPKGMLSQMETRVHQAAKRVL